MSDTYRMWIAVDVPVETLEHYPGCKTMADCAIHTLKQYQDGDINEQDILSFGETLSVFVDPPDRKFND